MPYKYRRQGPTKGEIVFAAFVVAIAVIAIIALPTVMQRGGF